MHLLIYLVHLAAFVDAILPETYHEHRLKKRGSALIPSDCFSSDQALYKYFSPNYPWGDHHNGAALMSQAQVSAAKGFLSLRSDYTGAANWSYNSGTVYANQHFTVPTGGGLDFEASYQANTEPGCWPAFWLTAVNGWPPEIDLAEWKGSGKVSFNTFNTSSHVASLDVPYPNPGSWHSIRNELRAEADGSTLAISFYLDGRLITKQYGANMVNAPFWLIIDYQMLGSSGKTGPHETTYFNVRGLTVASYP
ncbi:glycoside hydrolase family 16 protein [Pseudocercospora fijiensis CIRAD86]|uniref:Glycoside hydrolase family 16 protein n=1 Tax=Pseudocercospora fijiensis (strain CIRAD86) TaxID=383855 RepID=M2ZKI3_PSEFD|nr:glycoside hydrolase family 16 protein [Pseudocercospora fijiensis CIRAD86]EME79594.1 glycoside hydrolase family 16 protein [Pseudocercospora fijiensis CIRAD86]